MTRPQAIYVEFSPHHVGPGKLTKAWHVVAMNSRTILGEIKWYTYWRRYAFFPAITHQCLFDAQCLQVIAAFLEEQTDLQRADAARRRAVGHVLQALRDADCTLTSYATDLTMRVDLCDIEVAVAEGVIEQLQSEQWGPQQAWCLTAKGKRMMMERAA